MTLNVSLMEKLVTNILPVSDSSLIRKGGFNSAPIVELMTLNLYIC